MSKVIIQDRRPVGEEKYILTTNRPAGFTYHPGQFVMIGDTINGQFVRRAYTLSSHPSEDFLMFYIRRVPGGKMSNHLFNKEIGSEVEISGPMGVHHSGHFQELPRITYLVAGCGVAGVRSLVLEFKKRREQRVVHQERYQEYLVWANLFRKYADYQPVLSRQKVAGIKNGHIEDYLSSWLTDETVYYIVGSLSFVRQIGQLVRQAGLNSIDIHSEGY